MPDLKAFLDGGGEIGALIRARDWAATPLGDVHGWPQSLRSALGICLRSHSASAVFWGPDHLFLYNDAWAALLGDRHPDSLGRPAAEVLADIWPRLAGQFATAYERGEAVNRLDVLLVRNLGGRRFDSYWSYALLPVASEDGSVGGLFGQARETTTQVMLARQDALMLELTETLRALTDPARLVAAAVELVAGALDADRIGYAEADEEAGTVAILHCAVRGGMRDISGVGPIPDFGGTINDDLDAGRTIRIDDSALDERLAAPDVRRLYEALGVASALVVPIVGTRRYRAMLFAHHDSPRSWSDHEEALLRAATDRVWREITRARAETALRHSEQRYRRVFEQANDIILTADLDQVITDCNPAGAAAMGVKREEIIGRSIAEFVTPEGYQQTSRMLRHKLEKGGTTRHEIDVRIPSGAILHWEINSSLAIDSEGKVVGLHAIARDVTERRRHEERQRLLVNELNHRVKNTLSLVQGLALQTFKDGRAMTEAREVFQERLAALAAAHDLLTRDSWEGATLDELIDQAVGHHNGGGPRIVWSGPAVTLNPKAAVSLVMALHELSTNAAKYGALSVPGGRVTIGWTADEGRMAILWSEHDGPPVAPPAGRGFGLRMIERALAADLAAQARIDFEPAGLVCRIEAPLDQVAPKGEPA